MGEAVKIVAKNNKAYHDYFIEEKYETGIELAGTEVKSIRLGNVNLKDSFCLIKDGEISVLGMHISPYEKGNIFNKDPRRPRRLLMQAGDHAAVWAHQTGRLFPDPPGRLLQGPPGQAGDRPGQGQEAL